MHARIEAIRACFGSEESGRLVFAYDLIPKIKFSNGFEKYILVGSPAGFSWIGFILSFYVFSLIRNYRIFWVFGILRFISTALQVLLDIEFQLYLFTDLLFCFLCGAWFPYNRMRALDMGIKDMSVGKTIAISLFLGFIACSPALVIELLAMQMR